MVYPTTAKEAKVWFQAHERDIVKELSKTYRQHYASNVGYYQKKLLSSNVFAAVLFAFFLFMGIVFNFTIAILSSIALWGVAWLAIRPVIAFTLKATFRDREYTRVVEEYINNQLWEGFQSVRTEEDRESMENTFGRCLLAVPFDLPFDK